MPPLKKPQLGIMKATPLETKFLVRLGATCIAQPKLRGQRARTVWAGNTPVLLSSYGTPFAFCEHITSHLMTLPRLQWDGELYNHNPEWGQEKHNSVLNRQTNKHPEIENISYHIFDTISPSPQWQRLLERDHNLRPYRHNNFPIKLVPYKLIQITQWPSVCEEYLSQGYEGIILRSTENLYKPLNHTEQCKRPKTILKFKPTEYDEYLILDLLPGTGWCTNSLGAFLVCSPDNPSITFNVGTGPELTAEKRQYYWDNRTKLIGKTLIVRHEPIRTINGIPICTSAYKIK